MAAGHKLNAGTKLYTLKLTECTEHRYIPSWWWLTAHHTAVLTVLVRARLSYSHASLFLETIPSHLSTVQNFPFFETWHLRLIGMLYISGIPMQASGNGRQDYKYNLQLHLCTVRCHGYRLSSGSQQHPAFFLAEERLLDLLREMPCLLNQPGLSLLHIKVWPHLLQ